MLDQTSLMKMGDRDGVSSLPCQQTIIGKKKKKITRPHETDKPFKQSMNTIAGMFNRVCLLLSLSSVPKEKRINEPTQN